MGKVSNTTLITRIRLNYEYQMALRPLSARTFKRQDSEEEAHLLENIRAIYSLDSEEDLHQLEIITAIPSPHSEEDAHYLVACDSTYMEQISEECPGDSTYMDEVFEE